MTFFQSISSCLTKYFRFSGRASRSEFWWWQLFLLLTMVVPMFATVVLMPTAPDLMEALSAIIFIVQATCYIPCLAVISRRLHDIGKSGWWQLLGFVPLLGIIVLLIWWTRKGDAGANRFGPDPMASPDAAFVAAA